MHPLILGICLQLELEVEREFSWPESCRLSNELFYPHTPQSLYSPWTRYSDIACPYKARHGARSPIPVNLVNEIKPPRTNRFTSAHFRPHADLCNKSWTTRSILVHALCSMHCKWFLRLRYTCSSWITQLLRIALVCRETWLISSIKPPSLHVAPPQALHLSLACHPDPLLASTPTAARSTLM